MPRSFVTCYNANHDEVVCQHHENVVPWCMSQNKKGESRICFLSEWYLKKECHSHLPRQETCLTNRATTIAVRSRECLVQHHRHFGAPEGQPQGAPEGKPHAEEVRKNCSCILSALFLLAPVWLPWRNAVWKIRESFQLGCRLAGR